MRVLVIGAGIGGLVTAIGLQRTGIDVTVRERAPGPAHVGAGLSLFRNAVTALDSVGFDLRALGAPRRDLRAGQRRPDGRWLAVTPASAVRDLRVVHRAELHRALADTLRPGTIRYGTEIATHPEGYDVVVAADGLRSRTRASWPGDPGIRYSGYSTWRGVTPGPVDVHDAGETVGAGQRFGIAPLADGRVYWFAAATMREDTVVDDEYGEVRRRFAGWHAPIADLLDATPPDTVFRTPIHDLAGPAPTFRRGRTVLLGDAAHAMTPDLGQGAGQAVEDAATLSHLLAHRAPVDAALDEYDRVRRARTQPLARRARTMGRLMQNGGRLRDTVLRLVPAAAVARQLDAVQTWHAPAASGAR